LQVAELKKSLSFWISAANFEIKQREYTKARTYLQKARLKLPNDPMAPELWYESINLEILSDNAKIAQNLCSQAL